MQAEVIVLIRRRSKVKLQGMISVFSDKDRSDLKAISIYEKSIDREKLVFL